MICILIEVLNCDKCKTYFQYPYSITYILTITFTQLGDQNQSDLNLIPVVKVVLRTFSVIFQICIRESMFDSIDFGSAFLYLGFSHGAESGMPELTLANSDQRICILFRK